MRLFLAIELPEDAREHLAHVQDALRTVVVAKASWTRVENLHLTLKFLGEVADGDVPELCDALGEVGERDAMRLQATGLECFPPRGPFRVIGAAMGGDVERLRDLHAAIESACATLGHPCEQRDYRPHVTLARPRAPVASALRRRMDEAVAKLWSGPMVEVQEFVLMQSELHPEGSKYTPIRRQKFCSIMNGHAENR